MTCKLLYTVNVPHYFVSHRLKLALVAKAAGFEVHVATNTPHKEKALVESGFVLHHIPISRAKGIIGDLKAVTQLCKLMRQEGFDAVHAVALKAVLVTGIAAKLSGQKNMIFALTGLGFLFTSPRSLWHVVRFILIRVLRWVMNGSGYKTIFQNTEDMRFCTQGLRLMPEGAATLIKGSGVDPQVYTPKPEAESTPPIVLFPARLLRDKGIYEFVQAARILKSESVEARFVLVGDPDPANPTSVRHDQVQAWQDEGLVEAWGYRTDMPVVLPQAAVVCLPSYREGMPKALIEAAACARAIVTTDTTGCKEVVLDGKTGFCVPVKDVASLANAIRRLLEDKDLREEMGKAGRQHAESELAIEIVIDKTLALYHEEVSS